MTEKYLDFSFEKTNSAYMLFYERRPPKESIDQNKCYLANTPGCSSQTSETPNDFIVDDIPIDEDNITLKESQPNDKVAKRSLLSKDLEDWIWQDNRHYLEDRNIFEHTYFK